MKPKFELGDRVIYIPSNYVGTIVDIDRYTDGYYIRYDDDDHEDYHVHENDLEFADSKATFLTRLQELLATFNAEIVAIIGEDDTDYEDKPKLFISIGDVNVDYERDNHAFCDINAENVFDYDKG